MLKTDFTLFKRNQDHLNRLDKSKLFIVITEQDQTHNLIMASKEKLKESDQTIQKLLQLYEAYKKIKTP